MALTDHLLDVHGDDTGIGYDIGCSFETTVKNSLLLGSKADLHRLQMIVAAFHAYKHGRLCQLQYHPSYRRGLGIEDLEVMERVFSSSNSVAPCIRYASTFHWRQFLDLHFMQWDEDKYSELSAFFILPSGSIVDSILPGRFLYNNYRQSLKIIADYTPEVEEMKARLQVTDSDIDNWLKQEEDFFLSLKNEPDERVLESEYVRALYDKQDTEYIFLPNPASFY